MLKKCIVFGIVLIIGVLFFTFTQKYSGDAKNDLDMDKIAKNCWAVRICDVTYSRYFLLFFRIDFHAGFAQGGYGSAIKSAKKNADRILNIFMMANFSRRQNYCKYDCQNYDNNSFGCSDSIPDKYIGFFGKVTPEFEDGYDSDGKKYPYFIDHGRKTLHIDDYQGYAVLIEDGGCGNIRIGSLLFTDHGFDSLTDRPELIISNIEIALDRRMNVYYGGTNSFPMYDREIVIDDHLKIMIVISLTTRGNPIISVRKCDPEIEERKLRRK